MLRPSPTSLDTPLRDEADILVHRRLYCGHYSGCLDHSCREGWVGFTCLHCPLRDHPTAGNDHERFAHERRSASE
jgi:hypothetical protein